MANVSNTRACGACSMCCKSFDVKEIAKPAGKMCGQCEPSKGCKTWEVRPKTCQDFFCQWIMDAQYPDTWRPDLTKFILKHSQDGRFFTITLDKQYRDHWKKEPFYSYFKRQSLALIEQNKYVLVGDGVNHILVLPDSEVIIGSQGANTPFHVEISKLHGKTNYKAVIGG
jgi:hypothetical protein